ncbi:MAG: hypothetical protein R2716_03255 [Microthrixaceae bacterium]
MHLGGVSVPGSWDEAVTEATEALGGIDRPREQCTGVLHLGPLEGMEQIDPKDPLGEPARGPILGTRR